MLKPKNANNMLNEIPTNQNFIFIIIPVMLLLGSELINVLVLDKNVHKEKYNKNKAFKKKLIFKINIISL